MKKISLLIMSIILFFNTVALSENDYSQYSTEQLILMQEEIAAELQSRSSATDVDTDISALYESTQEFLEPYLSYLGYDSTNGDVSVSQDFIDGLTNANVLGYIGNIEHGYDETYIIVSMDWKSNECSFSDFKSIISLLNGYFDAQAASEALEEISDECYTWLDGKHLCKVIAWYESRQIHIRWFLAPEFFSNDRGEEEQTVVATETKKIEGVEATGAEYSYEILEDETAKITKYKRLSSSIDNDVVIPVTVDGYVVSVIGSECFNGNGLGKYGGQISVGTIVIPETVIEIEALAFHDITANHISLPSSIMRIAEGAFAVQFTTIMCDSSCQNYTVVENSLYEKATKKLIAGGENILDGIEIIGAYACYGYEFTSEDGYTIPNSVREIHEHAYDSAEIRCNGDTFSIPAETIGEGAFMNCSLRFYGLENQGSAQCFILFNSGLKEIPNNCFYKSNAYKNSHYTHRWSKSQLKYVSGYELKGQIITILFPDGVTAIGDNAFSRGMSIRIDDGFPSKLKSIGEYAFYVVRLEVEPTNLFGNTQELETIGAFAFGDTTIDTTKFENSKVFVIEIPNSVKAIGESAFHFYYYGEIESSDVYIYGKTIQIGDDAFDKSNVHLYVESGSTAEQWAKSNAYRYSVIGDTVDDLSWLNN